jgi:hypothetical protein
LAVESHELVRTLEGVCGYNLERVRFVCGYV